MKTPKPLDLDVVLPLNNAAGRNIIECVKSVPNRKLTMTNSCHKIHITFVI